MTKTARGVSLDHLRKKLIIRALGVSLIVALVALVASQQVTSSPYTSASKKNSHSAVKLDVVYNSAKGIKSSVNDNSHNDVSKTTNNSSANSSSSVSVTVNGRSISVPQNGSTQQTVTTADGSTSINITNNETENGTTFSSNTSSNSYRSFNSDASIDIGTNIDQSIGESP